MGKKWDINCTHNAHIKLLSSLIFQDETDVIFNHFYSVPDSFHSANTLSVDWQSRYCVIPTHSIHATPGNAYTIGFSQAPAYSNTHVNPQSWKESCYNTNIPKAKGSVAQSFCRAGTLGPHSSHPKRELSARAEDQRDQNQDILTVTTLSEIATTF